MSCNQAEGLFDFRVPQIVFNASPVHVLVDALERLAEAEQGEFDIAVQVTPAELPGQEGFAVGLDVRRHEIHQPVKLAVEYS